MSVTRAYISNGVMVIGGDLFDKLWTRFWIGYTQTPCYNVGYIINLLS